MRYEDDKKKLVKQRYNELALVKNAESMKKCCCNPAVPSQKVFTIMSEDYSKLNGYEPDAELHAKRLEQRAELSGWILRRTCCLKQGKMRNDEVLRMWNF